MTSQEQLDQLNQAIGAIENGAQEYQIGSRRLKRPDLSVLYQERQRLIEQVASESSIPPGVFVATFGRRR